MKRLLTAALATVVGLAMATSAFATDTRINSLSGGEKAFTVHDSANIYVLPQYMVNYKNSVDVDATNGATYGTMNIRYALSDDSVLLLFGKSSPWASVVSTKSLGGANPATAAGFTPGSADPTNHQFGIGFGMKASESMRVGATLSFGASRNDGDGTNQNNNKFFDLNTGLGLDLNETNSLDFGLNLRFGTFSDVKGTQGDMFIPDGIFGLGLLAKGEFQVHQIAKVVPYFAFDYDTRGVAHAFRQDTTGAETQRGKLNTTTVSLGADLAITPVEGVLVQPGLGLSYVGTVLDGNSAAGAQALTIEDSSALVPFYGFAAEAKAFDWMTLRLGARQTIVKTSFANTMTPPATNESHNSAVLNTVCVGAGFQLMGWNLDLNVNPAFINNGPQAVSGNSTAGFATDFALSYDW